MDPTQTASPAASSASCAASSPGRERRARERRHRLLWSIVYGNFMPRRRSPQRRRDDFRSYSLDWHAPHLLALSAGILLLSAADAFMTVTLMSGGAVEVNPVMAVLIERGVPLFTALKMGLTASGVLTMVYLAKYRILRVLRVEVLMYVLFVGYAALLGYEFWMLRMLHDILEQ